MLIVSVDCIRNDSVFAYANHQEFASFLDFSLDYHVLSAPGLVDYDLNMKSWDELQQKEELGWDFYPTYEAYVHMMEGFEKDFPHLVSIHSIGETPLGRELLFARISSRQDGAAAVPAFMYTATMHGDETAGFVLSLRLIHHLLNQYGEDERITRMLQNTDIWICPNENPDGTYTDDNTTIQGATRGNSNFIDLNRNYPNPVSDPSAPMQPETLAMIGFTDTLNFIMSANMHGGIELVNFPFDAWRSLQRKHVDHNWWQMVMQEYVDTVHAYAPPGYMTGMGNGVTHGGDWYVIYGSRQDYMNYYRGCREFTLELSNDKIPPPEQLPGLWEYNHRSLINYISQASYGIRGLVYDNGSGQPLDAGLLVSGHDEYYSAIRTSPKTGFFFRPIEQGAHTLEVTAEGFDTLLVGQLEVADRHNRFLSIGLPAAGSGDLTTVEIGREGEGVLTPYEGSLLLNEGANLFLEAAAAEGWLFSHWEVDADSLPDPSVIVSFDEDARVVAYFKQTPQPQIAVLPTAVDFGQVETGQEQESVLEIFNTGSILLSIDALSFDNPAFFMREEPPFLIEPGTSQYFSLVFLPPEEGRHTGNLSILSNAANEPTLRVTLEGEGQDAVFVRHPPEDHQAVIDVYPNPAGAGSRASLLLGSPMDVRLEVLSLSGQGVTVLFEGLLDSGEHAFSLWEAMQGKRAGIYFLRLLGADKVLYKRFVIL